MPSLDDVAQHQTSLDGADLDWLHRLVADWQIIADLSFADLLLWLPDAGGRGFWVAAQMRPTTGPTALLDDLVGTFVPTGRRPVLDAALAEGRMVREGDPEWHDEVPVRVESIPVRRDGRIVAVVTRSTNLLGVRTPSRLELAYLQTAGELASMIAAGEFPVEDERTQASRALRVGDGFVRTDADGLVTYASPNAMSAYRRLGLVGDLVGVALAPTTLDLAPSAARASDVALDAVAAGRVAAGADLENASASVLVRAIPLRAEGRRSGALVLLRDVTELRRSERELMSREATIREIHHRVKNNLQTVAALLRLQARRLVSPQGRQALQEAERRVGSIALVHETLSRKLDETVEFDEIADRLRRTVAEVSSSGPGVTTSRRGSFGVLPADVATPLAMVLTELIQNAVEHAFGGDDDAGRAAGSVVIEVSRRPGRLELCVSDDGRGIDPHEDPRQGAGLGVSIVATLVETELGGSLGFEPGLTGDPARPGTRVLVRLAFDEPG